MRKVGVFICHCGINIAGSVDVDKVAEDLKSYPGVAFATTYKYTCSDPGQQIIKDAIKEHGLDGVVVAACSPAMHETTFRRTAASAGMNPYLLECANIREQCSWVHQSDKARATDKAFYTIQSMVEKVKRNEALDPLSLPLTKKAMVIGGGIAGISAALDIADAGYPVILVEKSDHLGGKMANLSGTYLNFTGAPDLLHRRIDRVLNHPKLEVKVKAEVEQVDGYVGNFKATVRTDGQTQAFDVGAVVAATGYQSYPQSRLPEYGGGTIPDVIDGLTFEAMLAPGAKVQRPSDGKTPREVVFVQCAGSRDPEHGVPYCSKVCCMYTAKQAHLLRDKIPEANITVLYMDVRAFGKGFEEFYERVQKEEIIYRRANPSEVFRKNGKLVVRGEDTLLGEPFELEADLVVLASGLVPRKEDNFLRELLKLEKASDQFYAEAPGLDPIVTGVEGIFLAGCCQGPKDIPDTVAQASGAASMACAFVAKGRKAEVKS